MLILGVKGRTSLHLLGCTMQYMHAPAIRHTRVTHLGEREPRRQIAADAQRRKLNGLQTPRAGVAIKRRALT